MINKFRLKIFYKDNKITIDVDENIKFIELSAMINEKLLLNKCNYFEFLHNNKIISAENNEEAIPISDHLELDQELIYNTGKKVSPYVIKIIVWDYIVNVNDATMKKFAQLIKKVDQARPKQTYYLNTGQRKFIDMALKDCYYFLKELNFGGEYHYQLLKKNENYLTIILKYYMLDDKYELYIFDNTEAMNKSKYKYLITFYDTNRAYFKGYQGVNRNIFVLTNKDGTIKNDDFESFYNALNRVTYMFKDVKENYLFAGHDQNLVYDVATRKYWLKK